LRRFCLAGRSNFWQEGAQTPLKKRTTTEGGISYTWTANSFDTYTEPLTVVRASSGTYAASVSETLAWYRKLPRQADTSKVELPAAC
jgi:hypothetical protein